MRSETEARRLLPDGTEERVPASELHKGDLVVCEAGDAIPSDGEIVEGVASVDESAITGESAPVIRESGGDRSAVTGGTKVLSDRIVVRITAERGHTFLDRMISLVEGANRQKTPNEIALTILLAVLTIVFLPVVVVLQPFGTTRARPCRRHPRVAPRVPHPDHHRCALVGHRHRWHGPPRTAQRARHERACGRGRRGRPDASARQDRDDHSRQPNGFRLFPGRRPLRAGGRRRRPTGVTSRRNTRGPVNRGPRQGPLRVPRARAAGEHTFVPFSATTRMSGLDFAGRRSGRVRPNR